MLFNQNKGFFLTLDETAEPVSLDLPDAAAVEEPAADASVTEQPSLVLAAVEAPAASEATNSEPKAVAEVDTPGAGAQTTAEAIAADLAATQAARPAVAMSTYAPDNLMPGAGLMARKRRPGAGMKGFMTIAGDLFKS